MYLSSEEKAIHIEIKKAGNDFDLKKTFRYEEKPPELKLISIVMFGWVDITEKDL